MKSIYINSQGGLGFNLALASVLHEFHDLYDKVYVLSPYYDVFQCCSAVNGVYKPAEIRDFIFDAKYSDARLICERMYDSEDFIYKKVSYADAWRKAAGLPVKGNKEGSDTKSELHIEDVFPSLLTTAEDIKKNVHNNGFKNFVLMQFTGGQSPLVKVPVKDGKQDWSKVKYNYENEPLKRHYPITLAQKFVDLYRKEHKNTAIIMYQLPNEPTPKGEGIFTFTVPYLAYYLLAKDIMCKGAVVIDSSLQHLIAGVCPTTVIWGHSLPASFGYEYNSNIIQDCRRDDILYFSALGPSGARIDYIQPEELLEKLKK